MTIFSAEPRNNGHVKVRFKDSIAYLLAKLPSKDQNNNGEPIKGRLATVKERQEKGL